MAPPQATHALSTAQVSAGAKVDTAAAEQQLRWRVYDELVNMLYRQLPVSITGSILIAIVVVATLVDRFPGYQLAIWFSLACLNQASRAVLYWLFRRQQLQGFPIRWRARVWATGAAISGALWGATAIFFFTPDSVIHQALLLTLVLGATTAGVPLLASHMASLYVLVVPALTPFIARHLLVDDPGHAALGMTLLAVTLFLLSFGRNYNRLIVRSLSDRYENEALALQLARQNADLEQARLTAERANRSKTEFFAAASHDLRQPLHAMGLFAAALSGKVRDADSAGIVSSINASVRALEMLFNELLDISKLDAGAVKPKITSFHLDEVFGRLRSGFAAEAAAKGLCLSIATTPHAVRSDAVLLERILRNLISNAIRYTHAGEVLVSADAANDVVYIKVCDTGIGIAPEDQQRIFDEFLQLGNPARTSDRGLGLGLSIVRRLCALLGYELHLQSAAGEGATFAFEVPRSVAITAAPSIAPDPAQSANVNGQLIAVIDDEPAVRNALKALLSGWGAQVLASVDGEDIVEAVHSAGRLPDLMIVDYQLGSGDNGIDVAQRIRRQLDPEIPAIMLSGNMAADLAARARAANMEFVLKPVDAATLRERISAARTLTEPHDATSEQK